MRLYADIVFSLVLVSATAIAWGHHLLFLVASLLGSLALAARWVPWLFPSVEIGMWREVTTLLSIAMTVWILLRRVFASGSITSTRIQGAIAVYLLLGVGWVHAYWIAEYCNPGSFSASSHAMRGIDDWFYFSFVTLTTVGYGDIVPLHRIARSLAIAEALTGQLYLTVLLARLVALQIEDRQSG